MIQQSHFWACVSGKHKNSYFEKIHVPQCSQQHYVQNSQDMVKVSINRWVDKDMGHIDNRILFSHQKQNEIKQFAATQMDLENIILSQKKMNIIPYHLYVETKTMIKMNLFTKQK